MLKRRQNVEYLAASMDPGLLTTARHVVATLSKPVVQGLNVPGWEIPRWEVVDVLAKVGLHEPPEVGVAAEHVEAQLLVLF